MVYMIDNSDKGRKFVENVKHYCGHPETGTDVTNGYCPHCGRFITQEYKNLENCDYCDGEIQWYLYD